MDVKDTKLRYSSAPWFDTVSKFTVTICGVGGIGSNGAEDVAALGVKRLILIDPQTVETVNLAGQNYTIDDVGLPKVTAVANRINKVAPTVTVIASPTLVTETTLLSKITFCCFDNMEARRVACDNWVKRNRGVRNAFFCDCRLGATTAQLYCFLGDDEAAIDRYYKEGLFSSEEAEPTICTYKQTKYMAHIIGGLMADTLVAYAMKLNNKFVQIPFYREYDSPSQHYVWRRV